MKCRVCRKNPATVPDRNDWPSYRLRVCADCHAERLRGDLIHALARRTERGDA